MALVLLLSATSVDGKNTFLTGFGLGFLAFGLKKLLIPLLIGAKLVKSVLLALLLPSLIGSLGKIVGKGKTSIRQSVEFYSSEFEVSSHLFRNVYRAWF